MTSPVPRSITTATTDSGPAPRAASTRASRLRPRRSAPRNSPTSPHASATASGTRAARASNNRGNVAAATSPAVSFHSRQDPRPLGLIQHLDLPQPRLRAGGDRGQHPGEPLAEPRRRPASNKSAAAVS